MYHSYGASLFTARRPPRISEYAEEKRTEQYLFVRNGKSEAEVTNKRRLRSTYCTIKANFRQTRSIARPLCNRRAICVLVAVATASVRYPVMSEDPWLLSNGWTDFHQIFVNAWYPMKIAPPPKKRGRKRHFWAKIQTLSSSDGRCAETRRNSRKTKTNGISRLPSHSRLVKFSSGAFEL